VRVFDRSEGEIQLVVVAFVSRKGAQKASEDD